MAGIIGQITAQARVRRARKKVLSDKCTYQLQPFGSHGFDPRLHNNYVRTRIRNTIKRKQEEEEERFKKEMEDYEKVLYNNFKLI